MIRSCRHLALTLACLCLFSGHAGANSDIFKQILPDGSVIYSDQPHPDATRIEPGQPQVIESFRPPPRPAQARAQAPDEAESRYEHLAISSPSEDEVIWEHQNTIDVTVALRPALKSEQGHTLVILMDGDVVTEATSGTRFTLTEVWRGTHVLEAFIQDGSGRTLIEATPVTFHLRQHSIQSPTRPIPPR